MSDISTQTANKSGIDLGDIHYYDDIRPYLNEPSSHWIRRALNSAIALVIAYVILQIVYSLAITAAAKLFGLSGNLSLGYSILPTEAGLYSKNRVLLIYSAGPISYLMMSLVGRIGFYTSRRRKDIVNLCFFWMQILGISLFFSQFALTMFYDSYDSLELYTGPAVIAAWFRLESPINIVITIVAASLCVLAGLWFTKPLLSISHSFKLSNNFYGRRKLFFFMIFIPFLIATVLLFAMTWPKHNQMLFINFAGLALFLIGMFLILHNFKGVVQIRRNNVLDKVSLPGIVALVVSFIAIVLIDQY